MARMSKYLTICLVVVLAASSLLMVRPTYALTKPSVPNFTVDYRDYSYDTLPTTSIDPYSGKTVTNPAQHIENKSIVFTIKNQKYADSKDVYYNIRTKGYFENNWTKVFSGYEGAAPMMTNSDYTVLVFSSSDGQTYKGFYKNGGNIYAPYGQVDFQMESFVIYYTSNPDPLGFSYIANYLESGWSNTQTITIPASSSSVTPAPSSTDSQSSITPTLPPNTVSDGTTLILFSIVVVTLVISVISLLLYVSQLKRRRSKE